MKKRRLPKEKRIETRVEFGLDTIDETATVEVNLRKMLLIYKTISELRRFMHNGDHYQTFEQIEQYVGNKRTGMYSLLDRIYCKEFVAMLPESIIDLAESDALDSPYLPYYVTMSDIR